MGLRRKAGLIANNACAIIPASDVMVNTGAFIDKAAILAFFPMLNFIIVLYIFSVFQSLCTANRARISICTGYIVGCTF